MITPMRIAAATLLLLLQSADKAELRWKFTAGQELVYKYSQKSFFEVAGQPMEQEMGFTFQMKVAQLSDAGEATLQTKFRSIVSRGVSLQGEFDYDSEKDKEAPTEGPAAMQAKMVGQSFTMKMNPLGKVTALEGWDKVIEAMLKDAPQDNPQARAQAKQAFSNEAFQGLIQQAFAVLPEAKVGKDDAWSSEYPFKAPMIGTLIYTQKSKVTELKDGEVRYEQELQLEPKEGAPPAGPAEIRDAKGKATGRFSTTRNCLVSQKAALEMKLAIQGTQLQMKQVVEMQLLPK